MATWLDIQFMRNIADVLYKNGFAKEAKTQAEVISSIVSSAGPSGFFDNESEGSCPECGDVDDLLNVRGNYVNACHEHRIAWWYGFSPYWAARDEDKSLWDRNEKILSAYRIIDLSEAFFKGTCPCCGEGYEHPDWCINKEKRDASESVQS